MNRSNTNRVYKLMYKDKVSLLFKGDFTILDFNEEVKLPYGMQNDPNLLKAWLTIRFDVEDRRNYDKLMDIYGVKYSDTLIDKCAKTYATSFRDCYWIKDSKDKTKWEEVSPYKSYFNEMLGTLLGDEELLPPIPSKSCAEFTYRGSTAKGYCRDLKTGRLFVCKIPNSNKLLFREIISNLVGHYFGLNGLNYKLSEKIFTNGEVKKCLLVDSTATEDEGFITLHEFLATNGIEFNSSSSIDVYNVIPKEYKKEYLLTRIILFILDSENSIEDRFSFRIKNDTQEICGYFGVFGNSKCLLYDKKVSNYKNYRNSEQISEVQYEHYEKLKELLQMVSEKLNREIEIKLENLSCIFDKELNKLAEELIGEEEYTAIKEFIFDGADLVLNTLRSLNMSNRGVIETVDNNKVISYNVEHKERYDDDGFLKISEDSNYDN